MPIYVYTCSACAQRTEILHGINDPAPHFCPECGAEGTLRKGFAPPAVVFKGSGWAKNDRRATTSSKSADRDGKDGAKPAEPAKAESASGSSDSGGSGSDRSSSPDKGASSKAAEGA